MVKKINKKKSPRNKNSVKREKEQVSKIPALAIVSFVCGIFSILIGWIPIIGWIVSVLAIVSGVIIIRKDGVSKGLAKVGLVFGVIGLIIGLTFIFYLKQPPHCKDNKGNQLANYDCFIEAANECKDYSMQMDEDIGSISYKSKDCVFSKTVDNIIEDTAVKEYLEGTNAVCLYSKGEFNEDWVRSLHLGLEDCDGELREKLGVLLLFT
jgi:hypothetical protein